MTVRPDRPPRAVWHFTGSGKTYSFLHQLAHNLLGNVRRSDLIIIDESGFAGMSGGAVRTRIQIPTDDLDDWSRRPWQPPGGQPTGLYAFLLRQFPDLLNVWRPAAQKPPMEGTPGDGLSRRVDRLLTALTARVGDVRELVQLLAARVAALAHGGVLAPPEPPDPPGQIVSASRRPVRGPSPIGVSASRSGGGKEGIALA